MSTGQKIIYVTRMGGIRFKENPLETNVFILHLQ